MSERTVEVFVELDGRAIAAGRMFMRIVRGRQSASFSYHDAWLTHPRRFSLDPVFLPLGRGAFNTAGGEKLFPGLSDSAPDRWGRTLMARQARPRTLFESDYLLMVHDAARQGALRFKDAEGGGFLAHEGSPIPPLVRLAELLAAADRVQRGDADVEALRLLLAPGSSLGGARPKASVREASGVLAIAKFAATTDAWPVTVWEKVATDLAAKAKVRVSDTRLVRVQERAVLVARRFDRDGERRIPFLSAMAMIGAKEADADHSYLEVADAVRQHGERVDENLRELWRRMVFNVLSSNTDDHARNHGFLRGAEGWTLAPAYDLNPVPLEVRPRVHALLLDESSAEASLDRVLGVAAHFGIGQRVAHAIAGEVGAAVADWRRVARRRGLSVSDLDRMASAFEHADLKQARKLH